MRFENKTIIVTGAGGGIGRASALRLAREGAHVVCMDIADSREDTARRIKECGVGSANAMAFDAFDSEDVKRVFQEAISTHGPIDGLVNCVGGGLPLSALEIDEEVFDKMFDMNVKTTYRACWAVLPHMQEQRAAKSSISPPSRAARPACSRGRTIRAPRPPSSDSRATSPASSAPTTST